MLKLLFSSLFFSLFSLAFVQAQVLPFYAQRIAQTLELGPNSSPLERLAAAFTGHFSNKAQADTTNLPILAEQELICQRIWEKRFPKEYWLHIAWFPADFYKRPLAQALLKLEPLQGDTISMMLYNLPELEAKDYYEGEWFKAKPFEKGFPFKDMAYAKKCSNLVYPDAENRWRWHSPQGFCFLEVGELIRYIDFDVYLQEGSFESLSDFYTLDKQLVFQFTDELRHRFKRMDLGTSIHKTSMKPRD